MGTTSGHPPGRMHLAPFWHIDIRHYSGVILLQEKSLTDPHGSAVDLGALGIRLRNERIGQNLTLEALATKTGVSRAMISAIETGGKVPTIVVLDRVARGLGLRLVDLISPPETDQVIVLRHSQQPTVTDPSGWTRRSLAPTIRGLEFEYMRVEMPSHVDAGVFPSHRPGAREHIAVETGTLTLTINGTEYDLNAGDSISFDGECEHRFENRGDELCAYYLARVD